MPGQARGPAPTMPPLTVQAGVDKNPASIGDKIKYTIEVKSPKNIEVLFPSFAENLAGLTIKDFGSSESGFWGSKTLAKWYILDTYETGTFTIPGATIKFRKKTDTEWQETVSKEITVEVRSLLGDTKEEVEIHDIEPPISTLNTTYIYIGLALLALIIIAAVIVILLKKRKKAKDTFIPPLPAHEIAFKALQDLINKDYIKTGKTREYYFELSNIVRHYLENRFELKAPEMTTDEFLNNLKHTNALRSEHKSLLREFLSHCDMVKFARYLPEENEIESSYGSARQLVEQTRKPVEGAAKT